MGETGAATTSPAQVTSGTLKTGPERNRFAGVCKGQTATGMYQSVDCAMKRPLSIVPVERIQKLILLLRGQKVMLSQHLAELYGVPVKVLNQAVKRNRERFPDDFMFQLDHAEHQNLKSQFVTSSWGGARWAAPYAYGNSLPFRGNSTTHGPGSCRKEGTGNRFPCQRGCRSVSHQTGAAAPPEACGLTDIEM